ncbi:hypothetical protein CR513_62699, partial [Mucuna pruriens]
MVMRFSCWKGRKPASKTYKTTPHDQISALDPSGPALRVEESIVAELLRQRGESEVGDFEVFVVVEE